MHESLYLMTLKLKIIKPLDVVKYVPSHTIATQTKVAIYCTYLMLKYLEPYIRIKCHFIYQIKTKVTFLKP